MLHHVLQQDLSIQCFPFVPIRSDPRCLQLALQILLIRCRVGLAPGTTVFWAPSRGLIKVSRWCGPWENSVSDTQLWSSIHKFHTMWQCPVNQSSFEAMPVSCRMYLCTLTASLMILWNTSLTCVYRNLHLAKSITLMQHQGPGTP